MMLRVERVLFWFQECYGETGAADGKRENEGTEVKLTGGVKEAGTGLCRRSLKSVTLRGPKRTRRGVYANRGSSVNTVEKSLHKRLVKDGDGP